MLSGLKNKFSCLDITDPLRLTILTLVTELLSPNEDIKRTQVFQAIPKESSTVKSFIWCPRWYVGYEGQSLGKN